VKNVYFYTKFSIFEIDFGLLAKIGCMWSINYIGDFQEIFTVSKTSKLKRWSNKIRNSNFNKLQFSESVKLILEISNFTDRLI